MKLTKEQFEYWKALPETGAYFQAVQERINDIKDAMAQGVYYNPDSVEETGMKYASALHEIRGLMGLVEMDIAERDEE